MTAQGRQIINHLNILPPTDYGEFHFKGEIKRTIEGVMGRRDLTEQIMQRMTELGILVWSRTGRMAKVIDPEKSYRIVARSEGGMRKVMYEGLEEEQAFDICRDYGWRVDGGWQLEIEEE